MVIQCKRKCVGYVVPLSQRAITIDSLILTSLHVALREILQTFYTTSRIGANILILLRHRFYEISSLNILLQYVKGERISLDPCQKHLKMLIPTPFVSSECYPCSPQSQPCVHLEYSNVPPWGVRRPMAQSFGFARLIQPVFMSVSST